MIKRISIRKFFLLTGFINCSLLFLLLTGCTVLKQEEACPDITLPDCCDRCPPKKRECPTINVEKQILMAAESIEQSLGTLAAAQQAESPPILNTAPLMTPEGGMSGLIQIDWTGPIGPFVEKIARLTHYRVKFLGTEPAIPILIMISAKRAITAEVLQNASFQAGKRAHILVYPETHVIEVRYLPQ